MPQKILIVEDDPMIADVLGDIVVSFGYEVEWANNGRDALDMAELDMPDLVIMDLELPAIPGLRVAERLVRMYSDVKIVFSTGYSEHEGDIDLSIPNFITIVRKPFEITDIIEAIEKAFATS